MVAHFAGGQSATGSPLQKPIWFRLCRVGFMQTGYADSDAGWPVEIQRFPSRCL